MNFTRQHKLAFAKPDIGERELEAVRRVLLSAWLSSGPEVEKFEVEFAQAVEARHAVAVHSCTAALHLAASAWSLGPQDAVILPAITFTATAEVFTYSGCLPLILDVDRNSYLFSAEILTQFINKQCVWRKDCLIHRSSRRRVRALVLVHLGGRPVEIDSFRSIAGQYKLKLIEDAAHAFPASYKGKKIGSLSDATAFSFYATKNLSTGEGGMLTSNDADLADRIRSMRLHGIEGQTYGRKRWYYDVICQGYKYNMTDISAALGRVQLQRTSEMLGKRRQIHDYYQQNLSALAYIGTNPVSKHAPSYHLYVIEIIAGHGINRDQFVEEMYKRNIAVSLHFIPLYRLSYYRKKYDLKKQDYPNSESIYASMVSLPIYSAMSLADAEDVVLAIKDIFSYL